MEQSLDCRSRSIQLAAAGLDDMLPAGAYLTPKHPEEMLPMRVIPGPVTAFATGV